MRFWGRLSRGAGARGTHGVVKSQLPVLLLRHIKSGDAQRPDDRVVPLQLLEHLRWQAVAEGLELDDRELARDVRGEGGDEGGRERSAREDGDARDARVPEGLVQDGGPGSPRCT